MIELEETKRINRELVKIIQGQEQIAQQDHRHFQPVDIRYTRRRGRSQIHGGSAPLLDHPTSPLRIGCLVHLVELRSTTTSAPGQPQPSFDHQAHDCRTVEQFSSSASSRHSTGT